MSEIENERNCDPGFENCQEYRKQIAELKAACDSYWHENSALKSTIVKAEAAEAQLAAVAKCLEETGAADVDDLKAAWLRECADHQETQEERDTARAKVAELERALHKLDEMISDWARDQGFDREHSACWQVVRAALTPSESNQG